MAAIWRGALVFGLVNVQVKLHTAIEDHDISFHQVHQVDGGRVRYQRICQECEQLIQFRDIAKAWKAPDGRQVLVTKTELEALPVRTAHDIEVLEFVASTQIDPILLDRTYYLEPEKNSVRPYVLLREALSRTERTAIAQVAIRSKTQLAALRVFGNVIALQTMLWADEIRRPDFEVLHEQSELRDKELRLAADLITSLESDFDPDRFKDEYQEELLAMLEHKLADEPLSVEVSATETAAATATVVDLVSALQASIDRRQDTDGRQDSDGHKQYRRA